MNEAFGFTGSLGNLSVYKMKGIDKPIVRRKGGPSKERVKTHPKFEMTRRRNAEFGGRAAASSWIMRALHFHKPMADYNIAGPLNALLRPLQEMDNQNGLGQRSVRVSASPQLLKGFSLNRQNSFDSIVRVPVEYVWVANAGLVTLHIPALIPGINFFAADKYPWFGIVASLGIIPDIVFTDGSAPVLPDHDSYTSADARQVIYGYTPTHPWYEKLDQVPLCMFTPWHPVKQGIVEEIIVDMQLPYLPPDEHHALMLSIGIAYGIQVDGQTIQQAPYAGAAKILSVV